MCRCGLVPMEDAVDAGHFPDHSPTALRTNAVAVRETENNRDTG